MSEFFSLQAIVRVGSNLGWVRKPGTGLDSHSVHSAYPSSGRRPITAGPIAANGGRRTLSNGFFFGLYNFNSRSMSTVILPGFILSFSCSKNHSKYWCSMSLVVSYPSWDKISFLDNICIFFLHLTPFSFLFENWFFFWKNSPFQFQSRIFSEIQLFQNFFQWHPTSRKSKRRFSTSNGRKR